jgi:periplasmic divalent cation tolerance protein
MSDLPAPVLIWCPFPDADGARAAAKGLIEAQLVACANIIPAVQSLYQWQGHVHEAEEIGVLFKSNARVLNLCMDRLRDGHPYAEPAILAWECPESLPETVNWLAGLSGPKLTE